MVIPVGMIWESDTSDPGAPRAEGTPPPAMYQCGNEECHRTIGPAHKFWPLCSICHHNRPTQEVPF